MGGSSGSVLITGAARGIGRATAEAFAAAGWRVVAGVRAPDALVPFTAPGVHAVALDVTDAASVRSGVAAAEAWAGGPLDCVVNNAGWALFGAVEDTDPGHMRRVFETNVFGAVAVMQAVLPGMRRAGRGTLVSVSSVSGRIPLPLFGLYSATKLSLAAVTEAVALELGGSGIRAVLLEAGVVDTEFARATVISGSAGADDPVYAPMRDRLLGALRGVRETNPVRVGEVAAAILAAAQDPASPFRIVLADPALTELMRACGGPDDAVHARVRGMLGLDPPPGA